MSQVCLSLLWVENAVLVYSKLQLSLSIHLCAQFELAQALLGVDFPRLLTRPWRRRPGYLVIIRVNTATQRDPGPCKVQAQKSPAWLLVELVGDFL